MNFPLVRFKTQHVSCKLKGISNGLFLHLTYKAIHWRYNSQGKEFGNHPLTPPPPHLPSEGEIHTLYVNLRRIEKLVSKLVNRCNCYLKCVVLFALACLESCLFVCHSAQFTCIYCCHNPMQL